MQEIIILSSLLFSHDSSSKKKLVFEINGIANEEQRLKSHSLLNGILAFLIQKAEKLAITWSDRIVSVTPPIVSYLMTNFYCPLNKVEVIGNGVDIKRFYPIHDVALLRERKKRMRIDKEEIVIAFVGNLARWQGVSILIESAIALLSQGEKLKLLLVGDGPLKEELMRKVFRSGFEKEFIFTGMMDYEDIPFLINLADICVAPFILKRNRVTGVSPIKVFEYMACGKPVVATNWKELELLKSPAYLAGSVDDFINGLRSSLRNKEMSGELIQFAKDHSWKVSFEKIIDILNLKTS